MGVVEVDVVQPEALELLQAGRLDRLVVVALVETLPSFIMLSSNMQEKTTVTHRNSKGSLLDAKKTADINTEFSRQQMLKRSTGWNFVPTVNESRGTVAKNLPSCEQREERKYERNDERRREKWERK